MWSKVRQLLNQWLPASSAPSSGQVTEVHELLDRSEEEQDAFREWKRREGDVSFLERLRHAYNIHRAGMDPEDESLDFLEFQTTNGFILYLQEDPELAAEAVHIMDDLRDRIQKLGYRLAVSDRRIRDRQGRRETVEKHYLKPPLNRATDEPTDQLYGNITIELLKCTGHACNLKFITTYYTDRSYLPPHDFGHLMDELIG